MREREREQISNTLLVNPPSKERETTFFHMVNFRSEATKGKQTIYNKISGRQRGWGDLIKEIKGVDVYI